MVKERWNRRCLIGRSGQSLIEYLVVAAAVITAIIAIGRLVTPRMTNLGTQAGQRLDASATVITSNVTAVAR